jgi:hypothetical protein
MCQAVYVIHVIREDTVIPEVNLTNSNIKGLDALVFLS